MRSTARALLFVLVCIAPIAAFAEEPTSLLSRSVMDGAAPDWFGRIRSFFGLFVMLGIALVLSRAHMRGARA